MSFIDKVVIVTGAGSGIGADAAKHLAKLGAKVCLVDLNEKLLKIVADEIEGSDSLVQPLAIVADVTKDAQRIIDDAVKHFGKLDVLVNNAGIYQTDSVSNFSVTKFDVIFNINVRAVAVLTSLAVPHLEQTKGNIVNIASVSGLKANLGCLSYSMSKAALNHFTKCVAIELAPKGIRVNSLNPGMIRTPIFEKTGISAAEADNHMEASKALHLLGRIGEPPDISQAIAYVASDAASFVTGVLLPVDGGYILK